MDRNAAAEHVTVIRPRREADLGEASAALVAVHSVDGYPVEGVDQPEVWLQPPGLIQAWVAEMAGRVVGHVAVSRPQGEAAVSLCREQTGRSEDQIAVLARLFVHPAARGHSAGERLAREATRYAQSQGLTLVGDVMVKDTAAIRLYERLGCRMIGNTMHSYGDDGQIPALCFVAPEGR